ncbi:MAG: PhnD/SsuA/transferrin family substrate-binding protein [Croceibacterium sp.]
MKRRQLLLTGAIASVAASVGSPALAEARDSAASTIRFGTTPVFLDDQDGFLARWSAYLSPAVGTRVLFVHRRSYRDIMGLLRSQELEAAWICGFPWVVNKQDLRGLSIPLYEGAPLYRSYLIVPASDVLTKSHADLAGKVFAYSDPDSNSGFLVPRTTMMRAGINPDHHFSRTFFTWGHKNVVRAVGDGLANGGSVDGYVWETLGRLAPALVAKTRVAWRSPLYGFPPLAVRGSLEASTEQRLRAALFGMNGTPEGQALLGELNLTGFGPFRPEVFDSIANLVAVAAGRAA